MKRIAIIGAGISGLVLAQQLAAHAEVIVFEKARGVGGRMSTRYADPFYFDHGAQCFTARTHEFQSFLKQYMDEGIVSEWQGKVINLEIGKKQTKRLWFEPHLVASPNMNSLCKALEHGLTIRKSCEVAPLASHKNGAWELYDTGSQILGQFDWVISTAPPAQTMRLFGTHIQPNSPLQQASMQGCYALMLGWNKPWGKTWIAAKVRDNPIKWISVNSSKPGRNSAVTSLVVHSRNDWAEKHIDDDMDEAQALLLEQFALVTGINPADADYKSLHRWRYAIVDKTEKAGIYYDATLGLAASSDWCQTSRIEEVWQNTSALAAQLIAKI